MKKRSFKLFLLAVAVLLTAAVLFSCHNEGDDPAESETLPGVIETVESDQPTEADTEAETLPPSIYAVSFPAKDTPDYAKYLTEARIPEVLKNTDCVVVAAGASTLYRNDKAIDCNEGMAYKNDGLLYVDVSEIASAFGKTVDVSGDMTVNEAANALKCFVIDYDHKLAVFYFGKTDIDAYDDMYTLEGLYLRMTGADETEIVNAFIDLPSVISNGSTNTQFYTAPDLNLGVQSSVYYSQLGNVEGVNNGPRIVAGEGRWNGSDTVDANHTVVRVMNEQQTVTAQFLAFDSSVTGGVQVGAAKVGNETLIAACPFVKYEGTDGDVRVFDIFGSLRMDIVLRDVVEGPFTILTGRFDASRTDEVLLVMSQKPDANGMVDMILIDLSNGSVISKDKLDCSFAKGAGEEGYGEMSASVRFSVDGTADSVILFFPAVHAVYEGHPGKGDFANAGITLPDNAKGVSASANMGEKYIITLSETEDALNRSFMTVSYTDGRKDNMMDVGFRENVFYTAYYWHESDDYVCTGSFQHIRCDLSNGVMNKLNSAKTVAAIDNVFDNAKYDDYTFSSIKQYVNMLNDGHVFLEPCFTHRWNKISGTNNLRDYVDEDTGTHLYVSVGNTGEYTDYLELGSSFNIGTYADGILELAKLRIFPLRSFLRGTVSAFRGENGHPENLVGVSPVHEHEIDVAGTVGDYNVRMIRGFQIYMMDLYGTVEHINEQFGTEFTDEYEIDPPRKLGRGDWDKYSGDYFTQWIMYNRYIVSKRIMEAYREALIAGFPPESISAHSIPEGDAVAGFLGEADTRISPIDIVTTCGTAYGGTRYGTFYNGKTNFFNVANRAGQWSMTLGEYSATSESSGTAYEQLYWLWSHGLRMVHFITFNDNQAKAEEAAVKKLGELNQPRPGYTHGTTDAHGVTQNGKTYNIVQIGAGADSETEGLLKSVTADGKWEGTVYVVPFHAHVNVFDIAAIRTPVEGDAYTYSTGKLSDLVKYLKNADVMELTFKAAYSGEGKAYAHISVYNHGCEIPAAETVYELTDTTTPYRYVLFNQLYFDDVEIRITFSTEGGNNASITVTDMQGTIQQDTVYVKYFDKNPKSFKNSLPHQGGVTFDLIDRDMRG